MTNLTMWAKHRESQTTHRKTFGIYTTREERRAAATLAIPLTAREKLLKTVCCVKTHPELEMASKLPPKTDTESNLKSDDNLDKQHDEDNKLGVLV